MKKIYILLATSGLTLAGVHAQQSKPTKGFPMKKDAMMSLPAPSKPMLNEKAGGDIYYASDFSNASLWTWNDQSTPLLTPSALTIGTTAPTGEFSVGMGPIMSTTAANGFALFDSDAGASSTGDQVIYLTFNTVMDFTAKPNVTIAFESYHRKFNDSVYIQFKVGGIWGTEIEFDGELDRKDVTANPKKTTLNIGSIVGNQAGVEFRFVYRGEWDYALMVDDLKFTETHANEVVMVTSYLYTPSANTNAGYSKVPANQVSFPGFIARANVENQGINAQNVKLGATLNATPTVLGTTAVALASSAADVVLMDTPITGVAGVNSFVIATNIGANVDAVPSNNTTTITSEIGGVEYSRHDGVARQVLNFTAAANGLTVSNDYEIFDPVYIKAVKVRTNTAATNVGEILLVNISSVDAAGAESIVASASGVVTAANNGDLTIDFSAVDYLAVAGLYRVSVESQASTTPLLFLAAQKTLDATSFIVFSDGTGGWINDVVMNSIITSTTSSLGIDINDASFGVNMYPNPAETSTNVSISLTTGNEAAIIVTDLSGKTIYNATVSATNGTIDHSIATSEFANGSYLVKITANGTTVTKKLVVRN
jgi:hypothetical protein